MRTPAWKIAIAAVGLAMAVATGAAGADYGALKARAKARFAEHEPRLALSVAQKREVAQLIEASLDRRMAILQKHRVEPGTKEAAAAMKAAMPEIEAANIELRAGLAKILSPDQLKTFDTIAEELRKSMFAELTGAK